MTVSTELSHEEYTGNGVTTDFDFRFRIFEAKHLVVSVADPDGTERILTNGTDYTLRGVGSYRGGKVILKMPLATGWKIGIARDLPVVQETDLRNQGKFFAEVHEDAFDYLTMLIQKSLGYVSLCLRKPSFISDHYDAKGNKISNLGKPVKDGDAVDLGTMKEHIGAKDKRSLRVADKDIPALPGTSVRRNKQLGFDNNGMPLLLDPAETGALGYVLVDSFEDGAVITSRYQALHWLHNGEYYRWDGDLPKSVPAGSTPESAGGVGSGAWIGIGDASLRNDMNIVNSVYDLLKVTSSLSITRKVKGYVPGTNFGGGDFYWDASIPKSQHNGITIFSPTVPWDGSYAELAAFLSGDGEPDIGGAGCWIRASDATDVVHTEWAGHDITGENDSTASVNACINTFGGERALRVSPGTLKISFATVYQYHDAFNVARPTAIIVANKKSINVYAENDVNIDTDGNGEDERVCFGVINCANFSFSGLKFNQGCTNFSTGESDATFTPQENWFGFVCEGSSGVIKDIDVLAARVFCMADTAGGGVVHNKDITLNQIRADLITNYTFITRFLEGVATLSNSFMKRTGRTWHTFGEDFACADGTWHGKSINNHFIYPISIQARITPWGVRKSMNIIGDVKNGGGIFVEIGGVTGSIASQNVTITNCVSEGAVNADGTVSSHILIIGDDLDYSTSFNGINISSNTFKGGGIAMNDYRVGLLGKPAYGLVVENNNFDRTDRVLITSSAWVGTIYRNNKTHIQLHNTGCVIAGKFPTISGNNFDSTFLLASTLGYRIDGAAIENNNFSNILNTNIPRIMDWDNFTSMTYRNNRIIGLTGIRVFRDAADIIQCGWRHADATAGITAKPTDLYPGKVSQSIGDIVYNSQPTPSNFDFCFVAASGATWGKVSLVNA